MAEKKKTARSRKNKILLPHVSDDTPIITSGEETADGASLRAQQAVDGLIRDLFGKEGGVALATRSEPTPPKDPDDMPPIPAQINPP